MGVADDGNNITDYLLEIDSKDLLLECAQNLMGSSRQVSMFVDELYIRKGNARQGTSGMIKLEKKEELLFAGMPTSTFRSRSTKQCGDNTRSSDSASEIQTKNTNNHKDDKHYNMGRGVKVTYVKDKAKPAKSREECSCMAMQHPLVTNCTVCGKIVCELEGEGPCFFCGSYVTVTGTQISEEFIRVMKGLEETEEVDVQAYHDQAQDSEGLAKALAHKDKLLRFAQNSEKRTAVIDEQADYYDFQSNVWMNDEEKQVAKAIAEAEEAKLQERKQHRIMIDIDSNRPNHTSKHLIQTLAYR